MQARLAAVRVLSLRQPQRLDAVLVQAGQVQGHSGGWLRCILPQGATACALTGELDRIALGAMPKLQDKYCVARMLSNGHQWRVPCTLEAALWLHGVTAAAAGQCARGVRWSALMLQQRGEQPGAALAA